MIMKYKSLVKELYSGFEKIPILIIFVFLVTFHVTLLFGEYSSAMLRIFRVLYEPENENTIELIRQFLANIAVVGFLCRCWIGIKQNWIFSKSSYRISGISDEYYKEYSNAMDKLIKRFSKSKLRTELFIGLVILAGYFLDIVKYYQKEFNDFTDTVLDEYIIHLLVCVVILFASIFIHFIIDKIPFDKYAK